MPNNDNARNKAVDGIAAAVTTKARPGEPMAWLREAVATETEECQIWPFARSTKGYAWMKHEGRVRRGHQVALMLIGQELPARPFEIRHLCGRGHLGCVNVRHLAIGTHAENMADRVEHGTSNRGERCGKSKLTEAQVREIRADHRSQRAIAKDYGVSFVTVGNIKRGTLWGWLPVAPIETEEVAACR